MNLTKNPITFRCKHRHSAISHPGCYQKFLMGVDTPKKRLPKILVFDIETAPLKAFVFQKSVYKSNIGADQVISEWYMLTWSAKWLYGDTIMSERLTGKEAKNEDDARIVSSLWKLFDQADIIVAHNGDSFDIPNMNTRFIVHGFIPPSSSQTIDTKVVAQRQFGFTHNSLNGLAKLFGIQEKLDTDFELWKRCTEGDEESLRYMQKYNNGDVLTLEEVYLKLRPWIKGHPNLGLYVESEEPVCSNCGSQNVTLLEGKFAYTSVAKYPLYRCGCGALLRVRKNTLPKEVSKNLLVPLNK